MQIYLKITRICERFFHVNNMPESYEVIEYIGDTYDYSNGMSMFQYIAASESSCLGQAELVVIDEAAAIPLPLVRQLLGPYLVFLSSTVSGYEGTGRSLSLKLIDQLRSQTKEKTEANSTDKTSKTSELGRVLHEVGIIRVLMAL